VSKET